MVIVARTIDRRAEVHFVRGLARESWMWHLGVVLLDEKRHESAEALDRVERVDVQPLMLERPPECLDHRVGIGNIDLGEDTLQARAEQGGVHCRIDVLDAGVGVQKRATRENQMLASGEKKLTSRRGLQGCIGQQAQKKKTPGNSRGFSVRRGGLEPPWLLTASTSSWDYIQYSTIISNS